MKVKLLQDMELEIIHDVKNDEIESDFERFNKGAELEFDICDGLDAPEASEIQFGDGTVCFVAPDFWNDVEILENDSEQSEDEMDEQNENTRN